MAAASCAEFSCMPPVPEERKKSHWSSLRAANKRHGVNEERMKSKVLVHAASKPGPSHLTPNVKGDQIIGNRMPRRWNRRPTPGTWRSPPCCALRPTLDYQPNWLRAQTEAAESAKRGHA
eukprot:889384-Amphidinium_carterae.1